MRILLYFIISLFCSCLQTEQKSIVPENHSLTTNKDSINYYPKSHSYISNIDTVNYYLKLALQTGNKVAFSKISSHFITNNLSNEFYIYALIYANKYNDAFAYHCLNVCLELNENYLDSKTKKMSQYYILKAYELDSIKYKIKVDCIFKKKIPKSEDFKKYIF